MIMIFFDFVKGNDSIAVTGEFNFDNGNLQG